MLYFKRDLTKWRFTKVVVGLEFEIQTLIYSKGANITRSVSNLSSLVVSWNWLLSSCTLMEWRNLSIHLARCIATVAMSWIPCGNTSPREIILSSGTLCFSSVGSWLRKTLFLTNWSASSLCVLWISSVSEHIQWLLTVYCFWWRLDHFWWNHLKRPISGLLSGPCHYFRMFPKTTSYAWCRHATWIRPCYKIKLN
jgi:hypothetical protein